MPRSREGWKGSTVLEAGDKQAGTLDSSQVGAGQEPRGRELAAGRPPGSRGSE